MLGQASILFRLQINPLVLIVTGLYLAFVVVMILLPKMLARLPVDRGRDFATQAQLAKGKPTASGIVFIPLFIAVAFLVIPLNLEIVTILGLTFLSCLFGYFDDSSQTAWGEYRKSIIDLVLAVTASVVVAYTKGTTVWLPFSSLFFAIPISIFICLGTILIWFAINCTNCSDGVDGLSGTLAIIGLVSLGLILYLALGNREVATYLSLPFIKNGASWAILTFSLVGAILGYLWYNAFPSRVLMGDAGSRPLGFVIGVLVLVTGNPLLIFVVATMLLVNGGTGLIKVALLRFLGIKVFRTIRFPLHDHVRETWGWSNPQVLVRFSIMQVLIIISILGISFKIG